MEVNESVGAWTTRASRWNGSVTSCIWKGDTNIPGTPRMCTYCWGYSRRIDTNDDVTRVRFTASKLSCSRRSEREKLIRWGTESCKGKSVQPDVAAHVANATRLRLRLPVFAAY